MTHALTVWCLACECVSLDWAAWVGGARGELIRWHC